MIYLRKKWKQKPPAWGPASAVSAVSCDRVQKLYDIKRKNIKLLLPHWGPGDQVSYDPASNTAINTNGIYSKQSLDFTALDAILNPPATAVESWYNGNDATFISKFNIPDVYTYYYPFFIGIGTLAYLEMRFISGTHESHIKVGSAYNTIKTNLINGNHQYAIRTTAGTIDLFNARDEVTWETEGITSTSWPTNTPSAISFFSKVDKKYGIRDIKYTYLFDESISNDIIKQINDNPFEIFQPPTFRTYFIPSGNYYTTINQSASWKIETQQLVNVSWKLLDSKAQSFSWQLQNELSKGSAWKVLATGAADSSWKTLADISKGVAYKILTESESDSGYKILNKSGSDSSWKIFTELSKTSVWKILSIGELIQNVAWKILKEDEQDLSYKILTDIDSDIKWKSFSESSKEAEWKIFSTGQFDQDISWKISSILDKVTGWKITTESDKDIDYKLLNEIERPTEWGILTSGDQAISYKIRQDSSRDISNKIFNGINQTLSWNVLRVSDKDLAYNIFNELDGNISWVIGAITYPDVLHMFAQDAKIFAYNQETKTLIYYKE